MTATTAGAGRADSDHRGTSLAQKVARIVGAVLVLVGLLGFIADATFDVGSNDATGGGLQGDSFLGFEVNGWHNVVHLLSGLFLLAISPKAKTAKTGLLAFGLIYAVVTLIGLIDGNDVLGILPVNAADNVLHIALTALAIGAALASRGHDHGDHAGRGNAGAPAGGTPPPAGAR